MIRINLDDRKFVVSIAALFSGALAFVILRALLLSPGIIESIDIQWNQNFAMFEYFFHTWNFYTNGSNIIFASQFPIYGWVLVFRDVALAQRFVYFVIVSLVSFNMFLVTFYTLKTAGKKTYAIYLASIIASLIYVLNPLIFSEIFHISFLWSYALFPLVFFFARKAFNALSRRKVLTSALLLSMFFAFMADAWGMLVGLLIFIIVAFSSAVLNGWKNIVHRFVTNFLLTILIMGVFTVLLASYWLLPYVMQRSSGPAWDPFSVQVLIRNSQGNGLMNVLGLRSWGSQPFFDNATYGDVFFSVWQGLTLLLPVFAILAVIVRRNKLTLSLSGLLVVGFFLATGIKYSAASGAWVWSQFGEFYKWLTFYSPRILPNQAFLLKYPYIFLAIASLAIALLTAVLVADVFRRADVSSFSLRRFSKKTHGTIVLFFSFVSLIALIGAPLLSGNLCGALEPVTLPEQYKELNAFFSSQNGSFRVMYVPEEANFNWSANPWANKIEYWGSGATPLMYGWGISSSPNTGYLGDLVYDYLSTNQTQYLGKLLALGNVRYIVFHNDSENGDPASAYQAFDLYFTEYKDYLNSFLDSSTYTNYYLSDYLNFTTYQRYSESYTNSSLYQNFLNSWNPILREFMTNSSKLNSTEIMINSLDELRTAFRNENKTIYDEYLNNYKDSSIYQNLPNSVAYLNNSLHSPAYQDYLNNYQSSAIYQNFKDSPIYNNSHDYLNSAEYLILTGSQYFEDSVEYKDFMNSTEYRDFLYYYLIYSTEYQDFQISLQYTKYQAYLNYNRMNYQNMFNNLQSQKDLKQVSFSSDNLFVFENTEMMNYFQAYSKVNLVVGGLDTVGSLSSISDFYLNDSAFLFLENQHMSESDLASILNSPDLDKTLIFYDNKTFNNLVLDTIDAEAYIAPGDIYVETNPATWSKDVVTSYSWAPLILSRYTGNKYDFGLGHDLLYTTNVGSYVDLPFKADKSGEYSVWLRLLFSPDGGTLTVSVDGDKIWENNTYSPVLTGFEWVHLKDINLSEGSHMLTITSNNGFNVVNLVALPTVADLEEHTQNLIDLIAQSNVEIVYVMDRQLLYPDGNVSATVSFFEPQSSLCMISFQANQTLTNSALNVKLDNEVLTGYNTNSFSDDKNWYSIGPFNLSQGLHYMSFYSSNIEKAVVYSLSDIGGSTESGNSILGGSAEPNVVTYEKTGPVSFSVVVNASKTYILAFQESYDEFWQSDVPCTRLDVNSVANGYLINNSTDLAIDISYTPEASLNLGLMISLLSLIFSLTAIFALLASPQWFKKRVLKLAPQKP